MTRRGHAYGSAAEQRLLPACHASPPAHPRRTPAGILCAQLTNYGTGKMVEDGWRISLGVFAAPVVRLLRHAMLRCAAVRRPLPLCRRGLRAAVCCAMLTRGAVGACQRAERQCLLPSPPAPLHVTHAPSSWWWCWPPCCPIPPTHTLLVSSRPRGARRSRYGVLQRAAGRTFGATTGAGAACRRSPLAALPGRPAACRPAAHPRHARRGRRMGGHSGGDAGR